MKLRKNCSGWSGERGRTQGWAGKGKLRSWVPTRFQPQHLC